MKYSKKNKINEFITLKLVNNKTEIYILGEKFIQCKKALIKVDSDFKSLIDEVVDNSRENDFLWKISPEEEFWAHSSNIQVWVELNYDTSILHTNIAFPLLKKLSDSGDKLAKRKFAEEIAKKLESNYIPTITYLFKEGYLNFLPEEYRNDILKKIGYTIVQQKTEFNHDCFYFFDDIYKKYREIMNEKLNKITLTDLKFSDICDIYSYEYNLNGFNNKNCIVIWYIVKYLLKIPDSFDMSNRLDEFLLIFNITNKLDSEEIIQKLELFNNQQFNDEFIQPVFNKIINDKLLYNQFKRKYNTEENIYLKIFLTNSLLKYVDANRKKNDLIMISTIELIKPLTRKIIYLNTPEVRHALELSENVNFLNRLIKILRNGNENRIIYSLEKTKKGLLKRKIKKFTEIRWTQN